MQKRKLAATLIACLCLAPAAQAQTAGVTVDVNGQPVTFDQPPVERAGRIYVPLRGVFERLGATVVFENGQINATAGRHEIALTIGSTTATVDGTQQSLDSPPFLIGGRTLVPLRFISQALGASVNFDQSTQTVYVVEQAVAVAPPPPPPVAPPPIAPQPAPPVVPPPAPPENPVLQLGLLRILPPRDAAVNERRPEIAATFPEPVNPDSVHVTIDGRDVTDDTYVSDRSFVYDPNFDLPAAQHDVAVSGRTADHRRFVDRWSFATNDVSGNYLSGLEPPNGTPARLGFTVSAYTKPGSRVHVVATTSENIAEFREEAEGSIATDTVADGQGYFAARIALPGPAASVVDVRILATAPDGSVAVRTLRLRS